MKKEVLTLLEKQDYYKLISLSSGNKKILSLLISLSYDKKSVIAWRAIESIGLISKEFSKLNPEVIRNFIGRLLWMIRDESGGIGWSSPEILGEIVKNNPGLYSDIATVIVSFHEEPFLRAGVLRAIGRMGKISAEIFDYAVPVALTYLKSPDPVVRGYAAWALGEIEASEAVSEIKKLEADNNQIIFYEDGELKEKTVGEIAEKAVAKLLNIK
ncbi:MAG: DVU0298 family protein [Nitrospirota bacterium]